VEQLAFRNLSLRRLIQFAAGKTDVKTKTVSIDVKETDLPKYAVGENLSEAQFDALYEQATVNMGVNTLFMHDGGVGSHRWAEVRTRIITDDGNVALLAKHLLTPIKIDRDPREILHETFIVATSHLQLKNPGDLGLKPGPFIAVNRKKKQAIIGGTAVSSNTLMEAIIDVASYAVLSKRPSRSVMLDTSIEEAFLMLKNDQSEPDLLVLDENKNVVGITNVWYIAKVMAGKEEEIGDRYDPVSEFTLPIREKSIPLAADAIFHPDKKNTTVVFSHNGHFLNTKPSFSLYGAHNLFWSTSGLVHAWQGVNFPHSDNIKLNKGDVIEKLPNNKAQTIVNLNSPNAVDHPQNLVFLVSDAKSSLPTIGKLDPTQATQFFTAGYNGTSFQPFFNPAFANYSNPGELVRFFKNQVEKNKSNVFVVNSTFRNKEMSSQDLQKILSAVVDGSAAKAASSKGGAFSAVTSLQGVPNLESGNSSKFEEEMSAFLKTKFPSVTF